MSPLPTSAAMIPYYGPGAHAHYDSVRRASLPAVATLEGFASVCAARCILLEMVLEQTRAEVFVFIDSDVAFERADYDRLITSAHERQAVVGGAYLTRAGLDGRQRLVGTPDFTPSVTFKFFEHGELYPAKFLGMGFTAIPRPVIEQITSFHQMQKCLFKNGPSSSVGYPLFQPVVHAGEYWVEDHAFCFRADEAGVPLFVDTRPKLIHYGEHGHLVSDLLVRSQHDPAFTLTTGPSPIQRIEPKS